MHSLSVPMYKPALKLKGEAPAVGRTGGFIVGMATSGVVAWLCGAAHQVVISAIPKSSTTPITIEVSKELHGNPTHSRQLWR